jgi:hypothetical protein
MPESSNTTVLITGILALLTGVLGTLVKGCSDDATANKLASQKLYSDMILKTLEPADPLDRLHGLQLLIKTKLIHDDSISKGVEQYVKEKENNPAGIPQSTVAGSVPVLSKPATSDARIYLLTGKPGQENLLQSIRTPLLNAGFTVLNSKFIVDPDRPDKGEIRYFFPADKPQAKQLAEFFRVQLNQPKLVDSLYRDHRVSPGYLEIWTGR